MKRRRGTPNDPTPRRAMRSTTGLLLVLVDILLDMPEKQVLIARWGLEDGTPKTPDEIGRMYGLTRERVLQIERQAQAELRDPERIKYLRPLLVMDGEHPVDVINLRHDQPTLTHEQLEAMGFVWCAYCQQRPFHPSTGGRHRAYCSNKCRQAAYRKRQRQAGAADDQDHEVGELAG